MRNRIFNHFKKEDREKIFLKALRKKTQGLLQISEEVCLLHNLSMEEQFCMDVIFDAQEFKSFWSENAACGGTILYGETALENSDSSVAIWIKEEFDAEHYNRLVIYIPQQRKEKFRKTFIVED